MLPVRIVAGLRWSPLDSLVRSHHLCRLVLTLELNRNWLLAILTRRCQRIRIRAHHLKANILQNKIAKSEYIACVSTLCLSPCIYTFLSALPSVYGFLKRYKLHNAHSLRGPVKLPVDSRSVSMQTMPAGQPGSRTERQSRASRSPGNCISKVVQRK